MAGPAGVSIAYLSDLERGALDNPTLDKLRGIAGALRISLNDLLEVPVEEGAAPPLSGALAEFAAGDAFREATEQQAKSLRRDPSTLQSEWLSLLGRVEIAGRRPATSSDYLFIFESIRRAVEP